MNKIVKIILGIVIVALAANLLSDVHSIYVSKKMEIVQHGKRLAKCMEDHETEDLFKPLCDQAQREILKYPIVESFVEAVYHSVVFDFSFGVFETSAKLFSVFFGNASMLVVAILMLCAMKLFIDFPGNVNLRNISSVAKNSRTETIDACPHVL
jgi:hypothetical protein